MKLKNISFALSVFAVLIIGCKSLDTHLKDNDWDSALEYCGEIKKPECYDCYLKIIDFLEKKGNRELTQRIIKRTGEPRAMYNKMASWYYKNGKFEQAVIYYKKTGNRKGLLKTARVYTAKGEYEKAADIYVDIGDYSGVEKCVKGLSRTDNCYSALKYTKYLKKKKNRILLRVIGRRLLSQGKFRKAAKVFSKAKDRRSEKYAKLFIDIINAIDEYKVEISKGFYGKRKKKAIKKFSKEARKIIKKSRKVLRKRKSKFYVALRNSLPEDDYVGPALAEVKKILKIKK